MVECVGLENRFTRKGNEGSNPSLSADLLAPVTQVVVTGAVAFLSDPRDSRFVAVFVAVCGRGVL